MRLILALFLLFGFISEVSAEMNRLTRLRLEETKKTCAAAFRENCYADTFAELVYEGTDHAEIRQIKGLIIDCTQKYKWEMDDPDNWNCDGSFLNLVGRLAWPCEEAFAESPEERNMCVTALARMIKTQVLNEVNVSAHPASGKREPGQQNNILSVLFSGVIGVCLLFVLLRRL